MGNNGEFKTIPRKSPESRSPATRIKDFEEIHPTASDELAKEQATRCMECGIPFCHEEYGCPLGNLIPEWNRLIGQNKWKEAVERMLETDTFPEFTGKVCPAPCEGSCTMGLYNKQPVTIRQIELKLADIGFEKGWIKPSPPKFRTGFSVAVIGSGPAGLSAAHYLNRLGHKVTVYEKARRAGGLLTYGIPNYKLDKIHVVQRRIDLMEAEGVRFETGVEIGKDISGEYIAKNHDAILLALGAEQPRDLPAKGRELNGVHFAMEFLSRQSMRLAGEEMPNQKDIHAKGKKVIIIGGGDTGSDCLGTSHRHGATNVVQLEITPPPPKDRTDSNPWPLWPLIYRTSSSHQEGGERLFRIMTKEFVGENGNVKGLKCVKVNMVTKDGRMNFEEIPNSEFTIEADLILLAMGFSGPVQNEWLKTLNVEINPRGNIATDKNFMTTREGIFSAGDAANGQSLVVRAIASGRDAAQKINHYLKTKQKNM